MFSLPGAFTPTCSNSQLPGFEGLFAVHGVDAIYCVSVNDAFVMYQWGKSQGLQNVRLLPDGSGHFTRRMGMLINKDHVGFGLRSWRYAMVIDDGEIVEMFVEPGINDAGEGGDPYGETAPNRSSPGSRRIRARPEQYPIRGHARSGALDPVGAAVNNPPV